MRTSLLGLALLRIEERLQRDGTSMVKIFLMVLCLMWWIFICAVLGWHPYSWQALVPGLFIILLFGLHAEWRKRRGR